MYLKPIVEMDIIKIIEKNPNKSPGHDNIGNFILNESVMKLQNFSP